MDLEDAMMSPPVFAFQDFEKLFIVKAEALSIELAVVLFQVVKRMKAHPAQLGSKMVKNAELNHFIYVGKPLLLKLFFKNVSHFTF